MLRGSQTQGLERMAIAVPRPFPPHEVLGQPTPLLTGKVQPALAAVMAALHPSHPWDRAVGTRRASMFHEERNLFPGSA